MDHHHDDGPRDVWSWNLREEAAAINRVRRCCRYVAVDTEFPGFVVNTPRDAPNAQRYADMKANVDAMKLIQFGVTLFDDIGDDGGVLFSWQFNLREFDPSSSSDVRSDESIDLLRRSGIDFDKNLREGVAAPQLAGALKAALLNNPWMPAATWVTFHGLYDVAYLVRLLTMAAPLPDTLPEFLWLARALLGDIVDVKHIAKSCGRKLHYGETGLARMAKILRVEGQDGWAQHQAGHDSLAIAKVFLEIKNRFLNNMISNGESEHVGILYGVEEDCRVEMERVQKAREDFFLGVRVAPPPPVWRPLMLWPAFRPRPCVLRPAAVPVFFGPPPAPPLVAYHVDPRPPYRAGWPAAMAPLVPVPPPVMIGHV